MKDSPAGYELTKAVAPQRDPGTKLAEHAEYITGYAAIVDDANKRTLDPVVIKLTRDRGLT